MFISHVKVLMRDVVIISLFSKKFESFFIHKCFSCNQIVCHLYNIIFSITFLINWIFSLHSFTFQTEHFYVPVLLYLSRYKSSQPAYLCWNSSSQTSELLLHFDFGMSTLRRRLVYDFKGGNSQTLIKERKRKPNRRLPDKDLKLLVCI